MHKKLTAYDICNILTKRGSVFNYSTWEVVPNVYFGWGLHYEADLIAVSKSMWASEIEIKISKSDLTRDKYKTKFTRFGLDERIKKFWYAIPEELYDVAVKVLNPEYGIIVVSANCAEVRRKAKNRKQARKVTGKELQKLLHLGVLRYWSLREKEAAKGIEA